MAHILETFFMFARVFVWRCYGISRCFHGDKGNVSGSPELGLERSWLISRMKKSAVWPVLSHPRFHPTPVFSSCRQADSALHHPPFVLLGTCVFPHPAIYTCICKCHLFHSSLFSICLIFLLYCYYALIFDISCHLFFASHLRSSHLFSFFFNSHLWLPSPHKINQIWKGNGEC